MRDAASTPFEYTIRTRKGARHLRLSVRHDGSIVVTKPFLMPDALVKIFVAKHASWIEKKLAEFKKKPMPLLGKLNKRDYAKHKEAARALVYARIGHWNCIYKFEMGSVRIGNQKSRWGSCSRQKNLNFNYKILFLPKELQDYVVIHELCHLKELNHSERFWKLVAECSPEWKNLRAELKRW